MLKSRFYSWEELEEILSFQFTKKNNRKKLITKNIEPYYEYEIVKEGRKTIGLNILSGDGKSEFIRLCEQVAGKEVKFPKEETAQQILKFLLEDDWTILSNEEIGQNLPKTLVTHTVGTYIKLFKKYKILPRKLKKIKRRSLDIETGEIYSDTLDLNKYTYYIVNKREDIREEIDEEDYREMQAFIHQAYSEYIYDHADSVDEHQMKYLRKEAKKAAQIECFEEYRALPRKTISKVPTKKACELFMPYFDLLPTGKEEKKEDSSENIAVRGETDSISVVGRDPLQKDWDRVAVGLREDELWNDWWMALDRIEDELQYFWKLAMEVNLEQQTRKQVNKLLKDRWEKYASMLTCPDGSRMNSVSYEQKRKLRAMGIIRKNSLLEVS